MRALEARKIPISDYLAREGVTPHAVRKAGRELWYQSPIREGDTSPSFKVDTTKNLWFDHGAGKGGNVIDLVCELRRVTVAEALTVLSSIGGVAASQTRLVAYPAAGEKKKDVAFKVTDVLDIAHPALVQYLDRRRIPLSLARQHLKEIRFQPSGGAGRFFALGYPCGDGWDARSAVFKGFIGASKDITLLDAGDGTSVAVFEGVMDYLSLLAQLNIDVLPGYSVLILHSTAHVDRALKRLAGRKLPNVLLYLDHDAAGRAATRTIQAAIGSAVIDRSVDYSGHPDLNAWRIATGRQIHDGHR